VCRRLQKAGEVTATGKRIWSRQQFTSRIARTKRRIVDLDGKIQADASDVDQLDYLRQAAGRLRELAAAVGPQLADCDWHRRRALIRRLVQRIEIGPELIKISFRVTEERRSGAEPIVVTLARK
jgi:hypothetical protein